MCMIKQGLYLWSHAPNNKIRTILIERCSSFLTSQFSEKLRYLTGRKAEAMGVRGREQGRSWQELVFCLKLLKIEQLKRSSW